MNANSGHTLIELLIVVAIAVLLLSVAIPSFGPLIKDNHMVASVNQFIGLTSYARSESIKRSARVSLCPSADGASCLATGAWESGWAVFVDADDSGSQTSGDTLLQVNEGLRGSGVTLRGSANVANYLSYNANGLIRKIDGSLQSGTLVFCDDRGAGSDARTVTISAIGRLSVTSGAVTCTP